MTTVTRDGVTYEVEDGWRDMSEWREGQSDSVNVLWTDGTMTCEQYGPRHSLMLNKECKTIAWRPIVPPKVKRWRAERGEPYFFVDGLGNWTASSEYNTRVDDVRYSIGNYFRTREEAEASNKASVMRDPESER